MTEREFLVWSPGDGETVDDARRILATDAEEAAEKWAEAEDEGGDYLIVSGRLIPEVVVEGPDRRRTTFHVEGESVPSYTAREV